LEKFRDFLPLDTINPDLQLGEGNSPLQKLNRLMLEFGLPETYAKNESINPTGSFKDRGTAVAVQIAASLGITRIGTVSTGNMGISTAAYGAKAGMETFVFTKEDTPTEKLLSAGIHGINLIKVKGDYGKLSHKSFKIGKKHNIYFMNSTDPFRIEGYKVTGFEIFEQLNRKNPQFIFVPVSSGGHLIGLIKCFKELKEKKFIQRIPTFVGVQAKGSSPVAQAFAAGKPKYKRINKTSSIAQSITNPEPPGGNIVLKLVHKLDGMVIAVSDKEILAAQKLLARFEGIFCLPASATTLAGLLKLQKKRKFSSTDRIVLVITGAGVKNINVLDPDTMKIKHTDLSELDKSIASI
jgi:threonine synthase